MIKFLSLIIFVQMIFTYGKKTADETIVDQGLIFTKVDLEDEFVRNKLISLISYSMYINTTTHNETCRLLQTIDKDPEKAWLNSTVNEKAFIDAYIVHVALKKRIYKQKKGKTSCQTAAKKMKCRLEIEERKSKNGTMLSLVKLHKIQCPILSPTTSVDSGSSDAKKPEKKGFGKTLAQLTEKFAKNKDKMKGSGDSSPENSAASLTTTTTPSKGIGRLLMKFVKPT